MNCHFDMFWSFCGFSSYAVVKNAGIATFSACGRDFSKAWIEILEEVPNSNLFSDHLNWIILKNKLHTPGLNNLCLFYENEQI